MRVDGRHGRRSIYDAMVAHAAVQQRSLLSANIGLPVPPAENSRQAEAPAVASYGAAQPWKTVLAKIGLTAAEGPTPAGASQGGALPWKTVLAELGLLKAVSEGREKCRS